jgi:hypothetical protein
MNDVDLYIKSGLPKLRVCPKCKKAWLFGERRNGEKTGRFKINCKCDYAYKNSNWCKGKENAINNWNNRLEHRLYNWLKDRFRKIKSKFKL